MPRSFDSRCSLRMTAAYIVTKLHLLTKTDNHKGNLLFLFLHFLIFCLCDPRPFIKFEIYQSVNFLTAVRAIFTKGMLCLTTIRTPICEFKIH